ncbi:protein OCTOPUS-like [Salvia miltiorrhiza]|uniref:protein OCTOPUS-like n=1 Tax=Salvia miltiorrhiza TaxID=226208 RepID=UPI0025AD6026|nr:protein OCTOPUS-like [Salvia miltiorrhiza]
MNTTSADPTAPPPPPPQQQPPRSSFSCDRHPTEQFTGFCPSCLCERLTTLDHSSSNTPSSSRRPSSASAAAAAAIKSLFSSAPKASNFPPPPPLPKPSKSATFIPELRRTKSFSASKNEALGLSFEPQRKSCDVRVRNTLCTLFSLDEESKSGTNNNKPALASSSSSNQNHLQSKKTESCADFGEIENEEDCWEQPIVEDSIAFVDEEGDEIRPVQDSHLEGLRKSVELKLTSGEIVEEETFSSSNPKPMKDHIDLSSQEKKSSGGKIWAAASVFSKKWNNWRRKQKVKKQSNGENLATLPVEKPISRQFRETQSEIADYGFGRRSCDTDPRFSLDAGRMSFDDARYSFDEPRASWDGYLIGRSFPRMAPMVSVMEDAPAAVSRTDMQIPVEEPASDEGVPGGSSQTREYYLDSSSSSRRRKSLDRSSSIRKAAAAEIDELKIPSNAKVSPATADSFHGAKLLVDSNSNSLRDDLSETFELSSGLRDINSVVDNGETKEMKKSRRWSWRIWGFIQRRGGGSKDEEEEEKYSRANGVERSLSESWQETRRDGNGDVRGEFNRNMFRSNSSVSWRNGGNHIASGRKSSVEMYGNGKKRSEFVLEKNRSGRYSPKHIDNGLLRFYLTPMRGSRRGAMGKIKPTNSQPIARSVLRLY